MPRRSSLPVYPDSSTVLKAMIYLNIIMFVISLVYSGKNINLTLNPLYLLTPSTDVLTFLGASGRLPIIRFNEWGSLITANWLHGGLLHILFNMLALRTVAPLVMQEFGIFRMFSIYTLTAIAGFLLSYLGNVMLTIGASAGLCGLIGASLYFGKSRGGPWGHLVYRQTSGWVASLVLIGFLMPGINNWCHAGGLLSGIFLAWIMGYNDKRKENLVDISLGIFLAALTLWLLAKSVINGFILIYT
jgi:rhomboid protease GluP